MNALALLIEGQRVVDHVQRRHTLLLAQFGSVRRDCDGQEQPFGIEPFDFTCSVISCVLWNEITRHVRATQWDITGYHGRG